MHLLALNKLLGCIRGKGLHFFITFFSFLHTLFYFFAPIPAIKRTKAHTPLLYIPGTLSSNFEQMGCDQQDSSMMPRLIDLRCMFTLYRRLLVSPTISFYTAKPLIPEILLSDCLLGALCLWAT